MKTEGEIASAVSKLFFCSFMGKIDNYKIMAAVQTKLQSEEVQPGLPSAPTINTKAEFDDFDDTTKGMGMEVTTQ